MIATSLLLTLVGHTETKEEAEKIKEEYQKRVKNEEMYAKDVFIYEAKN